MSENQIGKNNDEKVPFFKHWCFSETTFEDLKHRPGKHWTQIMDSSQQITERLASKTVTGGVNS